MAAKVTNADLLKRLDELHERLTVIETEARIAKWVLRILGGFIASVAAIFTGHVIKKGSM